MFETELHGTPLRYVVSAQAPYGASRQESRVPKRLDLPLIREEITPQCLTFSAFGRTNKISLRNSCQKPEPSLMSALSYVVTILVPPAN